MDMKHGAEAREKVWELIKDIKVAMMATQDETGKMHSRPMVAQKKENFDATLWFFTPLNSRKVDEIEQNPTVLLSYSNPEDQNYVSISGKAEVIRDRALIKDMWSEPMRTWFPEGSDDPNLALVRVEAESAEYWDAPSSTFIYAYGYLKARLTGESPEAGEAGQASFQGAA